MRRWQLAEIDTPGGTLSPVVLHSESGGRAVVIGLQPGQELGDHQVKEQAFVLVVEGTVRVDADGTSADAAAGTLLVFAPEERHAVSSESGARLLLVLAPWPAPGHYRGGGADAPRTGG